MYIGFHTCFYITQQICKYSKCEYSYINSPQSCKDTRVLCLEINQNKDHYLLLLSPPLQTVEGRTLRKI